MVPAGISPAQGQRLQNQNVAAQILTWVSPFWSLQVINIFVKTCVDPLSIIFNKLIGWLLKRWLTYYTQTVIYIDTKKCFIDLTPILDSKNNKLLSIKEICYHQDPKCSNVEFDKFSFYLI